MRWVVPSHAGGRWARGALVVALTALAWSAYAGQDLFWTAAVAAGLIGSVVATTVLFRSRSVPTLAQVVASAETEPAAVAVGDEKTGRARPGGKGVRT